MKITLVLCLLTMLPALASCQVAAPSAAAAATQPAKPVRDDAPALAKQLGRSSAVVTLTPKDYTAATPIELRNVHDLVVFAQGVNLTADSRQSTAVTAGNTLNLIGCSNVRIVGLSIDGNRRGRGLGLEAVAVRLNACVNVTLKDLSIIDAVGDGVFLWTGSDPTNPGDHCRAVRITGCTIADPGRNCISVIHGTGIRIDHNTLIGAATSAPMAGLDVEPNAGDAPGITTDVEADHNVVDGCGSGLCAQGMVAGMTGIKFRFNQVRGCASKGIFLTASGALVDGNDVRGTSPGFDINLSSCTGGIVQFNTAGQIYADEYGVPTPIGHVLTGNSAASIDTRFASPATVQK